MKATLIVLAVCLSALALPVTADAHVVTCGGGDVLCYARCETSHRGVGPHDCAFDMPAWALA